MISLLRNAKIKIVSVPRSMVAKYVVDSTNCALKITVKIKEALFTVSSNITNVWLITKDNWLSSYILEKNGFASCIYHESATSTKYMRKFHWFGVASKTSPLTFYSTWFSIRRNNSPISVFSDSFVIRTDWLLKTNRRKQNS